MQLRRPGSELAHVAQHQQLPARRQRQHRDRRARGFGVGVVGVVDQRGAIQRGLLLQPPRDPDEARESPRDRRHRHLERHRGGARRERVPHVVHARRPEQRCGLAQRGLHHDLALEPLEPVGRAHRRRPLDAELHDAAAAREAPPQSSVTIVGVDHRGAARPEALEDLALGARDRLDGAEELEMRRARVVDERDVRRRQPGESANLALVVHAHLDHRIAVPGPQLEQGERHTDVVVQVAARGEHRGFRIEDRGWWIGDRGLGNTCLSQYRGQHFLDRRLAVAPGQRDQRHRELAAPIGRKRAQGFLRVIDDQQWQPFTQCPILDLQSCLLDQRSRRLFPGGLREKIVAVVARALERDEQRLRRERAGIGADGVERAVLPPQFGGNRAGGLGQSHHAHRSASAFLATAASENGRRAPRTSW